MRGSSRYPAFVVLGALVLGASGPLAAPGEPPPPQPGVAEPSSEHGADAGTPAARAQPRPSEEPARPELPPADPARPADRPAAPADRPASFADRPASPGDRPAADAQDGDAQDGDAKDGSPGVDPDCYNPKARQSFLNPDQKFGSVELRGIMFDQKAKLGRIVNIKDGDPFDLCQLTFLRERFDRLGYYTQISENEVGNRVHVLVTLEAIEHVRHVYVRHNWPLFKDEIMRRVRYRAGTRLPPKTVRKEEFNRQKRRIQEFLEREGYFNSDLDIVVEKTKRPHVVNLLIKLKKGGTYQLGRLRVQGNRALTTERIREVFEHRILWWKRAFTTSRFKEDLRSLTKLYQKKGYPGVRIRHDFDLKTSLDHKRRLVNINLTVRENKRILVAFEGNDRVGSSELRDALTFSSEGSYDAYEVRQSARAVQRIYQANGYFLAGVSSRRERVSAEEDRIVFEIEEGPRLRVMSITFRGNRALSNSKLRGEVKTRVFPRLGTIGLGSGGYLTDRQLAQDVKRIADAYRERGYLDAEVTAAVALHPDSFDHLGLQAHDTVTLMDRKRGELHVRFTISEGPRYRMDKVRLSGHPPKMEAALKKLLALKSGGTFTRKHFAEDLERLKRHFANQGYPYCLIKGTVKKSPDREESPKSAFIDVHYELEPGLQVRFGEIFLRGNHKTNRTVILRELKFKKGDIFSLAKVERARRNLRSLGIFRASRIEFIGLRSRENPVHVVVMITERYDDYGSLEIGIGLSTDNPFFMSLSYRNRNFLGRGKEIELKGEAGTEIQSGRVTYKDPRFIGSRLTFDLSGFVRREDTVRLGELLTYGGSVTLLHRVTRDLQWFVRYQIKRVRRQEEIIRVVSGQDEKDRVDKFTDVVSLGPTVIWDRRDNPLVPQKGYKLTGAARVASRYLGYPIRSADFVHLHFSGQGLLPLPAGIVIALGLRYDHGIPYGGSPMLPKTERFFAGGDTTVRGYEEDRLKTQIVWSPMAPFLNEPRAFRIRPEGGNIRMIANLELMFPLAKVFSMPILGVLFFDAGALTNSLQLLRLDDFKTSIGAALRLLTPVGFISLEYAIPFQPGYGTDPTGRTHFNFGFIF